MYQQNKIELSRSLLSNCRALRQTDTQIAVSENIPMLHLEVVKVADSKYIHHNFRVPSTS